MFLIVVIIVLAMLALTLWWLSESRKGPRKGLVAEKPDEAVRRAQHRDG